jgi:hypothetical protein
MNRSSITASQDGNQRALAPCSLWLLIGFIGATVLAAGILRFFETPASWLSALTLVVCGGIVAARSWRLGRAALGHAERRLANVQHGSTGAVSRQPRRASLLTNRSASGGATPVVMPRERKLGRSARSPALRQESRP